MWMVLLREQLVSEVLFLVKSPPDITSRGDNNTNTNKPALQMQETQVSLYLSLLVWRFGVVGLWSVRLLIRRTYNQEHTTCNQ